MQRALAHFLDDAHNADIVPLGTGLINRTYAVTAPDGTFVLQSVNPIFDPAIHHDIEAVTRRLRERGLTTPELVRTRTGELFATLDDGSVWRLMTFIEGVSFDALVSTGQARTAGQLFGRFHRALEDLEHTFVGTRLGVHDTAKHLASLRDAVTECSAHPLHGQVASIASDIDAARAALPPLPALAPRIGHGDPKVSNVLFDVNETDRAVCLIDLDTLGPVHLGHELGDAWRSWCNPAAEDASPSFDLALFEASLDGYREGLERVLDQLERSALSLGVDWISLELAARFAADALRERYFGWDETRYASRGEHNLMRAQCQLALHRAVVATRSARARLLG